MEPDQIVVVSGLPRSGTSMLMRMLRAGGLAIMTDGIRAADDDNPLGYFELETVKRTKRDATWLDTAAGKAVKVVSTLLPDLPSKYCYRIVFVRRDLDEVLASQRAMLARRGEVDADDESSIRRAFVAHVADIEDWLRAQPNVETLFVSFQQTIEAPRRAAERINRFLGGGLSIDRMAESVEPGLYRQRRPRTETGGCS
ncbi:MAG: sulfotransferase domain-containing protein [Pseudomonadota bacterium]